MSTEIRVREQFDWFPAEQTAKIAALLVAAGPLAWLEIHQQYETTTEANAVSSRHVGIIARVCRRAYHDDALGADVAAFDDGGGVNHSIVCPPICP